LQGGSEFAYTDIDGDVVRIVATVPDEVVPRCRLRRHRAHPRIASITIGGDVTGSFAAGDHFGFAAEHIEKLKIGPRVFTLTAGSSNDNFASPLTDDLRLLEVS
jgi:hypothetical protein